MKRTDGKEFPLSSVLAVTTGVLMTEGTGLRPMLELMAFMVGEAVWLHDAKRIADEVEPYLIEQISGIETIDPNSINGGNYKSKLKEFEDRFGETVMVYPIHKEDHTSLPPEVTVRMAGFTGEVIYSDDFINDEGE
jgi:hypothetical protein